MNEILLSLITSLAAVPIVYILLKIVFKKSIMFKFSLYVVLFMLLVSFLSFLQGHYGQAKTIYISFIDIILGFFLFSHINKILSKPLETAINQVKTISQGDINIDVIQIKSDDELGVLNNSIFQLVNTLKVILTEVNVNVRNLAATSQQLSNAAEQLSHGANEQASSIEEVSATIEQMSSNIEQNNVNAQQTKVKSLEANTKIKNVANRANEAVEANKDISQKITIINEIAFQTNILALNAAVEAARAGDQGKGFAVVAAEVRKLAERSKKAADEIIQLSQKSHELSENAGKVMVDVIPDIENTTRMIQEISLASIEQNKGAGQVNSAIQQLNNVTQKNASASEELASSAEELASQALKLQDTISYFKIN
jgi:methyl-accepting chemotaxis protein